MRRTEKLFRLGAVAAGLSLAGCAPGFGTGPGIRLGVDPTGGASPGASSCFLTGAGSAPYGMSRTANGALSFAPRIARIQALHSHQHADVRVRRESWKQVASGDC